MNNTYQIADNFEFHCDTDIEKYRGDTFWTKEPETIEWIKSFKEGDIFFDVGANIGVYSLYAASLLSKLRVLAFEPAPMNYERLLQNVMLNQFKNIRCFNSAFGSDTRKQTIFVPSDEVGSSGSQIEQPVDEYGNTFTASNEHEVQQHCLKDFPIPCHYLKIDVDGHEQDIIDGMNFNRLNNLKSMLIECNHDQIDVNELVSKMENHGFTTNNKFNKHPKHSNIRRGGNPENIIFTREANGK